ncbi:MAG: gliding motility protein GldM [Bacteroidales bacterium]|nr:gliding motility protein GldM [Bacteroidales bacterium]MCL2132935.1 gliding motility protein GldM [Bacteroidales bacterium]
MAELPKSPRQKMINMMYIVLTALLALNVSAEVLEAFVSIDKSIEHNIQIVVKKNRSALEGFQAEAEKNPAKVGPYYNNALLIANEAKALFQYIQDIKVELVLSGDGKKSKAINENNEIDPEKIDALSDTDVSDRIMIGNKITGKAYELRTKITAFRELVLQNVNPQTTLYQSASELLKTEDGHSKDGDARSWEVGMFAGVPLIAAVTNLSKLQLDVYNSESEAITHFAREVNADDFKFSDVEAFVVPTSSNYVVRGSKFTADVFLTAYDPSLRPVLRNASGGSWNVDKGKIKVEIPANELGPRVFSGVLEVGESTWRINHSYMVVNPNTVISPTKMNVFYRGIENPVSISASGASLENIEVSMTNARHTRQGDIWNVIPGDGRTCEITVKINGQQLDQPQSFRVKDLPVPMPLLDGITSKSVSRGELQASQGIRAEMPSDFEFDLRYRVASFKVSATIDGYTEEEISQSAAFTDRQKRIFNQLRSGQRLSFVEIKAIGPDGKTVELYDLSVKIK